jgi:hypothetical protein
MRTRTGGGAEGNIKNHMGSKENMKSRESKGNIESRGEQ